MTLETAAIQILIGADCTMFGYWLRGMIAIPLD